MKQLRNLNKSLGEPMIHSSATAMTLLCDGANLGSPFLMLKTTGEKDGTSKSYHN